MSVNDIELSVRAANSLNNANIVTVGQLIEKTEADLLKHGNFGAKSLGEIKEKLREMGLSLGMYGTLKTADLAEARQARAGEACRETI